MNYTYTLRRVDPKLRLLGVIYHVEGRDDFFKNFSIDDFTQANIQRVVDEFAPQVRDYWEAYDSAPDTAEVMEGEGVAGTDYKVIREDAPVFDSVVETLEPTEKVDEVAGKKTLGWAVVAKPLEEAKAAKRQQINAIRDRKETEGFMFNGTLFDSDERSADRIAVASQAATAAILASQAFEVTWTAADNSEHVLDAQGVLNMNAALAKHGLVLHETAKRYKRQIEAATTHEELKAIVWE